MLPFRCIYVLLMGFVPSFATIGSCRLHSVSLKQGIYCPADGRRALNLLSYQCRYTCIHSSHCTAINYNNTNGICNLIASTCPVALSDPTLEFVLFVPLVADSQCYEWRPIEWNSWDRAVKLKDTQYVARILRSGSHYVGRWSQIRKKCFARDGDVVFKALKNELNCQSLWIKDGCTSSQLWRYDLWLASICDCGTICDHIVLRFVTRHDLWPKVLQFVTSVIQWF